MALAYKIEAEKFGKLDDSMKALYKQSGTDYVLEVDGIEDVSGLKSTIAKLTDETKAAKKRAHEAQEEKERIAQEKAKKDNDFESLYKSSEESRAAITAQLEEFRGRVVQEKTNNLAMTIAGQLAKNPTNAELLSAFIKPRIKVVDDEVQVLNARGEPTVATVDDLKKEFATSGRYDSLITGNQSGGGGASSGTGGGAAQKTITRSAFNGLSDKQRLDHVKTGGSITDD